MSVWVFLRESLPDKDAMAHAVLVSVEQHIELVAAFEACIAAGGNPDKVWRGVLRQHRLTPTWILSCMLEIERHRLAAGLSEHEICETAGLAERGYAKWRNPWGRGGRVPTRATLTALAWTVGAANLDTLMVGSRVPRAMTRDAYQARLLRLAERHARDGASGYRMHQRARMRMLSPLGVAARRQKQNPDVLRLYGMRGGWAAADAMTSEQRRARAKKAAKARWDRVRAQYAAWA